MVDRLEVADKGFLVFVDIAIRLVELADMGFLASVEAFVVGPPSLAVLVEERSMVVGVPLASVTAVGA